MAASVAMEVTDFPSLEDIISVQTVDVVQNVVVADQLKRALDYCFSAIVDLQRPDRNATPEDLNKLQNELRAEIAELKADRQAAQEESASQQAIFQEQLQAMKEQQEAAAEQVQELQGLAQGLQATAEQLTSDHELNVSKLEEVQAAINQQRSLVAADLKEVHTRVTADIKDSAVDSKTAVQSLLDETSAIRQEIHDARDDASQQVSALEQQLKASEEEAAVQKLADLQSADDIITTRMAAANVEGLSRAVAALSRESARADATIRDLQAAQQSLQAQLIGKAGVSELQAVAGRRSPRFPAAAAGSEGAPLSARGSPSHQEAAGAGAGDGGNASEYAAAQFALLHERITGKADAEEAAGLQLEVAALKRAVGPALLAQQQDPTETGAASLQDDMDKLLERVRKLESTLGAQEIVSAIMRRSASARGVQNLPLGAIKPSLLSPGAEDEAAVVEAAAALGKASEADLKSLESQIKSLKGRVARGDGELASIKGVISYLQTELIRKADRDDVTKLKISGLLSPRGRRISPRGGPAEAGGEAAEKAAGAEGEAGGDSTLEEATLEEADRALVEEVTNLVTGLATRQEVDVISQRLDDKSDAFTLQALQEDVQELQEELDAAKRGDLKLAEEPQAAEGGRGKPEGVEKTASFSFNSSPSKDSDNKTPYNTQELPDAQPTPNNTLANPRGGQPSPRGNLLGYVASVLSRRNTREVTAANGDRSHGQDPVQALLAAKPGANMQEGRLEGQLPSYETIVAHQQALGQHVQRLTDELAKLRRSSGGSFHRPSGDGDHTILSRKPLSGYICMACDRPLGKLSQHGMPSVPTKKMSHQVQMEYIPAHGVMNADSLELRTQREASGLIGQAARVAKSPPRSALSNKRTGGQVPAIDQPRKDVGPLIGQGGWKSAHPHGTSVAGTTVSRPGTAIGSRRG